MTPQVPTPEGEQLALPGLARRRSRRAPAPPAEDLPVARVVLDLGPAHLDRTFEYLVPEPMSAAARPGVRVRARFGKQDVDGYVLERVARADHVGDLTPLRRVVSDEVVLAPEVLALARAVAERWAGTLPDVLRLAVPPRHARTEAEQSQVDDSAGAAAGASPVEGDSVGAPAGPTDEPLPPGGPSASKAVGEVPATASGVWSDWPGGVAFLRHVAGGGAPRAVWTALPGAEGHTWADAVAQAVVVARQAGRGSLVVVPSLHEVGRVQEALLVAGVPAWRPHGPGAPGEAGGWVRLHADDGPAARYRAFLAVARGEADVVVGTRAAVFAPVRDLGLVVCWDDGHHLHAEPRAPYPHVRDVARLRSDLEGTALLVGGMTRTTATQRWLEAGEAHPLHPDRATVRRRTPRVMALTSVELAAEGPAAAARLPHPAWRVVRDGLTRGPVLVQVPRAGYLPAVACVRCRAVARCAHCHGPLEVGGAGAPPSCRWCGALAGEHRCAECGAVGLRSVRVGSERTAEELGRAFPGVTVRSSGASAAGGVLDVVPDRPALVVATPGAEPRAPQGYAAALLLDAAVVTGRPTLDVTEQALRTWLTAAALVRPAQDGGVVVLVGDADPVPSQALVRWDPAGLAERELAERAQLSLPPAVHLVSLEGPRHAVDDVLGLLDLPPETTVLGPRAVAEGRSGPSGAPGPSGAGRGSATGSSTGAGAGEQDTLLGDELVAPVRALLRTPWPHARPVVRAVAAAQGRRSARRAAGAVRVRVEPDEVL